MTHRKLPRFLLPLFALMVTVSPCLAGDSGSAVPASSSPLRVLILNSYHHGYTWTDRELSGINTAFEKSNLKTELLVEFMDSKRHSQNMHFEQMSALFAVKYGKNRPALVITLDNPAFEFAIQYRQKLFSGIPIVFAGLNDYEPSMLKGEAGITGIVEKQDIVGTIKIARAIQPDLKEVVILHDFTSSGLASRKEAEEQLATLASSIKLRYLPDMTIENVAATLKELQPGSVLIPFSYSRDLSGRVFNHSELTGILSKSSAVPVYGTKEERLGYGIIGGSLLEGMSHGARGAELAIRILNGENPAAIPVITEPKSRLMFDHTVMKRFGVNSEALPAGSEIINVPPGFYRQHAAVLNVAAAIILLLSGSLAFMIVAHRQRNKAEEALVESERRRSRVLESANREMESFCYAVSHDLQTPLRHILSFSSIIEEDYGKSLDSEGMRCLGRIKAASTKMGELIKDLLVLSQVSRGELNRVQFNLGDLALKLFGDLQFHENSRSIKMTTDKDLNVFADIKLVGVILDNLIGNAWKYTAKTPEALIHLGAQREGGQVTYYLKDNGAGFDMQYAENLFAPFQRLHSESEFEGNGIGLATVQRIINRHGGQIWADSKPGEGATFFFTLRP